MAGGHQVRDAVLLDVHEPAGTRLLRRQGVDRDIDRVRAVQRALQRGAIRDVALDDLATGRRERRNALRLARETAHGEPLRQQLAGEIAADEPRGSDDERFLHLAHLGLDRPGVPTRSL